MAVFLPPGVALTEVRVKRTATGPGYLVRTHDGTQLEGAGTATTLTDDLDAVTSSDLIQIGVECDAPLGQTCSDDTAFADVRSVELTVVDASAPHMAIGGFRSPAAGTMTLDVAATDVGSGLASATAYIDGQPVSTAAFAGCAALSPGNFALDRLCPSHAHVALAVDTTAVANGDHELTVKVFDAAGNRTQDDDPLTVFNQATATPTPTPGPTPVAVAATPAPAPTPVPVAHCTLVLPKRLTPSSRIAVRCPASAPAPATLKLSAAGRTLASGSGTVAPGYTARLELTLTRAARASLRRHGTLKATLTLYEGRTKRPGVTLTLRTR